MADTRGVSIALVLLLGGPGEPGGPSRWIYSAAAIPFLIICEISSRVSSDVPDMVCNSVLVWVGFDCGLRNTGGSFRSILIVRLRRGRGVCGWPVDAGDEAPEGVSGSGGAGEAKDELLGVGCRCLTAAAKILMSFLKAVLSSA